MIKVDCPDCGSGEAEVDDVAMTGDGVKNYIR